MASDLRGNRIRALVIGSSLGIAWIALVFGYVQREEANRLRSQIKACEVEAIQCQAETEKIKERYEKELRRAQMN